MSPFFNAWLDVLFSRSLRPVTWPRPGPIVSLTNGLYSKGVIWGEAAIIYTPRKINMEPENTPLGREKYLPNHHFQVLCYLDMNTLHVKPAAKGPWNQKKLQRKGSSPPFPPFFSRFGYLVGGSPSFQFWPSKNIRHHSGLPTMPFWIVLTWWPLWCPIHWLNQVEPNFCHQQKSTEIYIPKK